MIIYEGTCEEFVNDALRSDISIGNTIREKMNIMHFQPSIEECRSWNNSLPALAKAINISKLPNETEIGIEYNIKGNRMRIDALICGKDDRDDYSAVIIELKQWSIAERTEKQYYVHTNGGDGIRDYWHPSYQATNYAGIITNFYDYVQDHHVKLHPCSYLHNMDQEYGCIMEDLSLYPLIQKSPVFLKGDDIGLAHFIDKCVKEPCKGLLKKIDESKLRPSPELANMLHDALDGNDFFSYSDEQADAVSTIEQIVRDSKKYGEKRTIIIRGSPGTGKSIVAINVLGKLIPRGKKDNKLNAAYFTCNQAPRLLYSKKLIGNDYSKKDVNGLFKHPLALRDSSFNEYDCALFDEAHRMYVWKGGTGLKKEVNLIERCITGSRVSVFFIDEDQAVTVNDHASIPLIKKLADKCGSRVIDGPKLETQFRVLGGSNYLHFIRYFLGYDEEPSTIELDNYDLQVFDSASKMKKAIIEMDSKYHDSRIVAGYTYEWVTKDDFDKGYDIVLDNGEFRAKWNMKANDRSWLAEGSIDEVGSIHTCQGLDMQYCGVIIGKDLRYEDGHIIYDPNAEAKSDRTSGIRTCKDYELACRLIRNTYNVLLSRGMRGTFVYCEDENLRNHLIKMVNDFSTTSRKPHTIS